MGRPSMRGAKIHNGPREQCIVDRIMSVRDPRRPIEIFFDLIKKGDTPETNQASKLVLEWVIEFEGYIK